MVIFHLGKTSTIIMIIDLQTWCAHDTEKNNKAQMWCWLGGAGPD